MGGDVAHGVVHVPDGLDVSETPEVIDRIFFVFLGAAGTAVLWFISAMRSQRPRWDDE